MKHLCKAGTKKRSVTAYVTENNFWNISWKIDNEVFLHSSKCRTLSLAMEQAEEIARESGAPASILKKMSRLPSSQDALKAQNNFTEEMRPLPTPEQKRKEQKAQMLMTTIQATALRYLYWR